MTFSPKNKYDKSNCNHLCILPDINNSFYTLRKTYFANRLATGVDWNEKNVSFPFD